MDLKDPLSKVLISNKVGQGKALTLAFLTA